LKNKNSRYLVFPERCAIYPLECRFNFADFACVLVQVLAFLLKDHLAGDFLMLSIRSLIEFTLSALCDLMNRMCERGTFLVCCFNFFDSVLCERVELDFRAFGDFFSESSLGRYRVPVVGSDGGGT
jgi:hypothetical protein